MNENYLLADPSYFEVKGDIRRLVSFLQSKGSFEGGISVAVHAVVYAPWPFRATQDQQERVVDYLKAQGVLGDRRQVGTWEHGPHFDQLGVTVHGYAWVEVVNHDFAAVFGGEDFIAVCPQCQSTIDDWSP